MDSKGYLKSYGWVEGELLKKGGLKKPILVKHKKDTKGLGHDSQDGDPWWERLFDAQLKGLDVVTGGGAMSFVLPQDVKVGSMLANESPLYKMFVKGEGLAGTVGDTKHVELKQPQQYVLDEVIGNTMKVKKPKKGKVEKSKKRDHKHKHKDKKHKNKDKKVKKHNKDKKHNEI